MASMRQLGRRETLGDTPLGQHRDTIGDGAGERQVVGDDDLRGAPRVADALVQVPDLLGEQRVEIRRRLVVEDELGIDRQGASDGHPLAHAARELARQLGLGAGELHLLEDPVDDGGDLGRALPAVLAQAEADVLVHRQRAEEGGVLEHHGHAKGFLVVGRRPGAIRRDAADRALPRVGLLETDDLPQEHGLARTALSHDRQQFPRLDDEIDAPQDALPVVGLTQARELHADAAPSLCRLRHQSRAKVMRTMRKSNTRMRMKLQTTAAVVEVAMPSVPPRVRSPKAQGTMETIMPKIAPFDMPTTKSRKCTHRSMRSRYVWTGMVMAGSSATTAAPPHTPMKSAYRMRIGRAMVAARKRGTTRKRTGSMSMVRRALISS